MLKRARAPKSEAQQNADHTKEEGEKEEAGARRSRKPKQTFILFPVKRGSLLFSFSFTFFFLFQSVLPIQLSVESSLLAFFLFSLFVSKEERPAESLCLSSQFIHFLFVCFVLFTEILYRIGKKKNTYIYIDCRNHTVGCTDLTDRHSPPKCFVFPLRSFFFFLFFLFPPLFLLLFVLEISSPAMYATERKKKVISR